MAKNIAPQKLTLYSPRRRITLATVSVLCFLLLLAGGAMIPFLFESQTMYYKFGLDKTLLRLGKIAGISAALFMGLQLLLAGRFKPVNRIWPLYKLLQLHKVTGVILLCLAILHPLLVIAPEGLANLPIGWKFWPEYVGATLLVLLTMHTVTALFRTPLKIPFNKWRWSHRIGALLIFSLLLFHVRFVSETFEKGVPLQILTIYGLVYFCLTAWKLVRT